MAGETTTTDLRIPYHKTTDNCNRIPTLEDLEREGKERKDTDELKDKRMVINQYLTKRPNYNIFLKDFGCRSHVPKRNNLKKEYKFYNYCFLSVILSFVLGLILGVIVMGTAKTQIADPQSYPIRTTRNDSRITTRNLNSLKVDLEHVNMQNVEDDHGRLKKNGRFSAVTFTGDSHKYKKDIYPKGLTEDMKDILKDNKVSSHRHIVLNVNTNINNKSYVPNGDTVLYQNVYWGPEVEDSMPQGYGENTAEIWEKYVNQSEILKMQTGCGRMQNRLVIFRDGIQACVRYRQNTDQIQGEIFSFYVARLLNLTNLAPSVVKVVDLKDKLWKNVANDIASAQWNTNRAVVLTQYIPSLELATIPDVFKPSNRHLNKKDILEISMKETGLEETKDILLEKLKKKNVKIKKDDKSFDHIDVKLNKKTIKSFVELAQWSDLIIFDYLTANLDRIVNNLFNFQWNINIMDGPAHNLARKMDSGLLLFLDNESGLLHGYRLLKKYNVYHSQMLDNLCVFRKTTISALKTLYSSQNVGAKLSDMFHKKNNAVIRDILPPLPEKNAKILHERIGKVLSQVEKCEQIFGS